MKKGLKPRELTLLGLLTALLIVMSCTPLGYLNIGPLAITFNVIPVAVAAIALGPTGGAIIGAVFGITSFLQAMGIGGVSSMGVITFEISPFLTFIQRFVTRVLVGLLTGLIYNGLRKTPLKNASVFIAGFCAAFLNTLLFMGALFLLFGRTEYVQGLMAGRSIIVTLCTLVGINAVVEMLASTFISGVLGKGLQAAKMIGR